MKIIYHKNFLRDLKKLSGNKILLELINKIDDFKEEEDLLNVIGVKKLKGFSTNYRIRFGNYRLGFRFEDGNIIFDRFLHRKDIYKKYP